jgi:hypothetical protein
VLAQATSRIRCEVANGMEAIASECSITALLGLKCDGGSAAETLLTALREPHNLCRHALMILAKAGKVKRTRLRLDHIYLVPSLVNRNGRSFIADEAWPKCRECDVEEKLVHSGLRGEAPR